VRNPHRLHPLIVGLLSVVAIVLIVFTWHTDPAPFPDVAAPDATRVAPFHREPISPLPVLAAEPPAKVALGERLFHDPLLSSDRSVSCASCHDLALGATDRRARSLGVGDAPGAINSPTLFNSVFNFVQFWDGRAATLEDQIAGPLHDPAEMATSWPQVIERLQADRGYRREFAAIYAEGISEATIRDAIASFERSLVTPDAPFDRYLRGEETAIPADAIEGYARFKAYGCTSCHQGVNVGGNLFQRFGVMGDYFAERGDLTRADLGRFNVTGREADRHVFKVPGLRNVAATAPYFHDGSVEDLDEAVGMMGRYQLGRELSAEDRRLITAFLRTLSGNFRGTPVK